MLDKNRHKFLLVRILKDIYSDLELAGRLGFKGGTALMLFYDLPRFSVDLDFNLLEPSAKDMVFDKLEKILLGYGSIRDKAQKHFGMISVLDYGEKERNLKIEISEKNFPDTYEIRNFLGINMKVMRRSDMFAHKLCALLDRKALTARDIFDCWFFMEKRTPVNEEIIRTRMNASLADYLERCISAVSEIKPARIMSDIGDLLEPDMKQFVKTGLINECVTLMRMYREFPLIGEH